MWYQSLSMIGCHSDILHDRLFRLPGTATTQITIKISELQREWRTKYVYSSIGYLINLFYWEIL